MNPLSDLPSDQAVITATKAWIERAVIGLNLCPFASVPFAAGQIRYAVNRAESPEALLEALAAELQQLSETAPADCETVLLIAPVAPFAKRFRDFNDFLGLAEELLGQLGYEGEFQLASFHPEYQFAGTRRSDVTNFTNRAPHPTLHLLREASVERAIAAVPDTDAIFERNLATMRNLEEAQLTSIFGLHAAKKTDG